MDTLISHLSGVGTTNTLSTGITNELVLRSLFLDCSNSKLHNTSNEIF